MCVSFKLIENLEQCLFLLLQCRNQPRSPCALYQQIRSKWLALLEYCGLLLLLLPGLDWLPAERRRGGEVCVN